jgi:hypothetical protein
MAAVCPAGGAASNGFLRARRLCETARSMARPPRVSAPARVHPVAPSAWASVAVGILSLAVYAALAPPVPGDGDSSEFVAVLGTLGVAHPTGYPLYTIAGHLFVRALHLAGVGWARAGNTWSACGAALALALWHALATRLLVREGVRGDRAALLALLPAAAFGLDPSWTAVATVAEVDSWHQAWVAGACLLATATLAQLPQRREEPGWLARRVAAWSTVVGLGLAHHATSLLFAGPLTVALVVAGRPWRARLLLPALAGAVPLLAGWGYVYARSLHPADVQWGSLAPGLRAAWQHVTAAGYTHYLGRFAPSPGQRAALLSDVAPWLLPGLALAALWCARRSGTPRTTRCALAAGALLAALHPLGYGVSDPVGYFLPGVAAVLFVAPAALAALPGIRRRAQPLAWVAAAGLLLGVVPWLRPALRRDRELMELDSLLRSMWRAVPVDRGWFVWDDDRVYRLIGYQRFEGDRPGLVVVRPRLLMDDGARTLFIRRFGVDPLGGAAPPADSETDSPAAIEAFARGVATALARGPEPVVVFDGRTLQLLEAGGAPPAVAPVSRPPR